ncbi:MAG: hypothetical protein RDU30_12390 [Desulfovibrionaceae bacterium]|nr:hypothetical protein [Desulfovibrionaceae bacterium]
MDQTVQVSPWGDWRLTRLYGMFYFSHKDDYPLFGKMSHIPYAVVLFNDAE